MFYFAVVPTFNYDFSLCIQLHVSIMLRSSNLFS